MVAKVVVVVDVAELRAALGRELCFRGGFEVVEECGDGPAAVAAARAHQPDVVVLDLGLPDLAGHEVLTGLRDAAPDARIVVFGRSHLAEPPVAPPAVDAVVGKTQDVAYLVDLVRDLGGQAERTETLSLGPDVAGIAVARHFVAELCDEWGCAPQATDAQLLVTELVTNAFVHAGTGCEVRIGLAGPVLRVEVVDGGGGVPDVGSAGTQEEGGRGLYLVSALSIAWGAEAVAGGGKRVWAELATDRGVADRAHRRSPSARRVAPARSW